MENQTRYSRKGLNNMTTDMMLSKTMNDIVMAKAYAKQNPHDSVCAPRTYTSYMYNVCNFYESLKMKF